MDEIKQDPNYYAVIPSQVRYDPEISASAKLLYGEIAALSNRFGYCCATNGYFAELYSTKIRTVQRWIGQLADQGYVRISPDKLRKIYLLHHDVMMPAGVGQKSHGGVTKKTRHHDKKVTHNNTSNNTSNKKVKEPTFDAHDIELIDGVNQAAWTEWLDYKQASKHPYKTSVGITKAMNMLAKYPAEVQQQIIDTSVMNEYRGIFEPKTNGAMKNGNQQVPKLTPAQRIAAKAQQRRESQANDGDIVASYGGDVRSSMVDPIWG